MKSDRIYQPHLAIRELKLAPGAEWKPQASEWSVLHVSSGVGYWMQGRMNFEILTGAAAVVSERSQGVLRSSQINSMVLDIYTVQPERLAGVLSLGEQQALAVAARKEPWLSSLRQRGAGGGGVPPGVGEASGAERPEHAGAVAGFVRGDIWQGVAGGGESDGAGARSRREGAAAVKLCWTTTQHADPSQSSK